MSFTTRPEIRGSFGVVASTHWIASCVGMAVLEGGGNAFDAAVAAGFTLQVVEPHLNGPAGEAPILFHSVAEGRQRVICGQGVAPARASIETFQALGLDLVPGSGLLAATTPAAFDAWMLLLRDHGTWSLGQVLSYAIGYASDGHALAPLAAQAIRGVKDLFCEEWPGSAALYVAGGAPAEGGEVFRNPILAGTYRRLVEEAQAGGGSREAVVERARRVCAEGFVAEAIDRFCRDTQAMDSSGRRHAGLLTGQDMAAWRASYEDPQRYDYGAYTVLKTGPWGQGPVFLQALSLLKGFALGDLGPADAEFVHLTTEAIKLAYADREAFYGDPDAVDVPMQALLSDRYADARRRLIGQDASLNFRPGVPEGRVGYVASAALDAFAGRGATPDAGGGLGEPTVLRDDPAGARPTPDGRVRGDTCHLDVIDRFGNMVSATPSGGWLQSSPTIPELGFALGTRAQMFWLDPRSPAALAPGRRPRSTLSPGLALRDGEPYLAFGTPGGDQQDQWSLIFFLRHVHHGLNLQAAIDAPMFHSEHFPGSFFPRRAYPGRLAMEGRFPDSVRAELARRGHGVDVRGDWSLGRLSAASRASDELRAAANPRGMQGYAVGR